MPACLQLASHCNAGSTHVNADFFFFLKALCDQRISDRYTTVCSVTTQKRYIVSLVSVHYKIQKQDRKTWLGRPKAGKTFTSRKALREPRPGCHRTSSLGDNDDQIWPKTLIWTYQEEWKKIHMIYTHINTYCVMNITLRQERTRTHFSDTPVIQECCV